MFDLSEFVTKFVSEDDLQNGPEFADYFGT